MISNTIWNTELINEQIRRIDSGDTVNMECFYGGDVTLRNSNILFQYTRDEQKELLRCASDVVYFANNYCYAMTDAGIKHIVLRDYQVEMLRMFQNNRYSIVNASRQIGKTTCSSIFILWYICFNYEKNILVIANKLNTTIEIVDKIRTMYRNLPFFLKPGISSDAKTFMKFDNGCRLFSQATTKTSAIGFTIHLLYADEFAHINRNFIVPFYRSIFPTLSSSDISRIIITSTPNKFNLFYELYMGAMEGKNDYKAMVVPWYKVAGRDEEWKQREIANLGGNEELFNQEYGCQFLTSSSMLLSGSIVRFLEKIKKQYIWQENEKMNELVENYGDLLWDDKFDFNNINNNDKFIFSIDLSDGVGKDYTVCNIFKIEPVSIAQFKKRKRIKDETDMFRLRQIGIWRSNIYSINEFASILSALVFDIFNSDNVKIVLEINFKGDLLIEYMSKHRNYYSNIFLHTQHSSSNKQLNPGVKIKRDNKDIYVSELKTLIQNKYIIINEKNTIEEIENFGLDKDGRYRGQMGHDDCAMTLVNLVAFINSNSYGEIIEDMIDIQPAIYRKIYDNKIFNENNDNSKILVDFFKEIQKVNLF